MNRNEEYRKLRQELDQTPPELEYTLTRAKAKADRHTLRKRLIALPAATLTALLVAFVILVNTFTSFAMAMSELPLLSDLAAAVAFSPSLSAAIKNEYVQPIGLEQENNGVTMRIEYVIVDEKQLNVFYTVKTDRYEELWPHRPTIALPDGAELTSWSLMGGAFDADKKANDIRQFTIDFLAQDVPEALRLSTEFYEIKSELVEVTPVNEWQPATTPPSVVSFDFLLSYDRDLVAKGDILQLDQTIQLGDQTITLDHAEIYPTHLRLNLKDHPDNSAWLIGLDFDVIDRSGRRFSGIDNGINASSISPDGPFMESHRIESPYFSHSDELTLLIKRATFLDKTDQRLKIDLVHQTADRLPEGVRLKEARQTDQGWELTFLAIAYEENHRYSLFSSTYYDEAGNEYDYPVSSQVTATETIDDQPAFQTSFLLPDYHQDTVYLTPHFSRYVWFETPIAIRIK